jgi:hypothetical protein
MQTAVCVANEKTLRAPGLQDADDVGQPVRDAVPDDDTVADITVAEP